MFPLLGSVRTRRDAQSAIDVSRNKRRISLHVYAASKAAIGWDAVRRRVEAEWRPDDAMEDMVGGPETVPQHRVGGYRDAGCRCHGYRQHQAHDDQCERTSATERRLRRRPLVRPDNATLA